jgi:hypothetical protein
MVFLEDILVFSGPIRIIEVILEFLAGLIATKRVKRAIFQ